MAREVTIQVIPGPGRDMDALVAKAAALARGFAGIGEVQPYSKAQSSKLLEPWLGSGLTLDELPVPRLIVVKIAPGAAPDISALRHALTEQVPGAVLDDHRGWIERMRAMAGTAVAGGIAILVLVVAATMLSVTFATRGAMATNKPVIEVLHFVGAKNGFIAGHFQRHFLMLGLQGGVLGGGVAVLLFAIAGLAHARLRRHRRRRADRGAVRHLLDRDRRLCRGAGADRADRGGHRAHVAPHRQPHFRGHRLDVVGAWHAGSASSLC